MSGLLTSIAPLALTWAAAVVVSDRLATWRRRARHRRSKSQAAAHAARIKKAECEPSSILSEIRRQIAIGRASFLSPTYHPPKLADEQLQDAGEKLLAINRELLRFEEIVHAPLGTIDIARVCSLWEDFMSRRQAARDRWTARRRELERCRT